MNIRFTGTPVIRNVIPLDLKTAVTMMLKTAPETFRGLDQDGKLAVHLALCYLKSAGEGNMMNLAVISDHVSSWYRHRIEPIHIDMAMDALNLTSARLLPAHTISRQAENYLAQCSHAWLTRKPSTWKHGDNWAQGDYVVTV